MRSKPASSSGQLRVRLCLRVSSSPPPAPWRAAGDNKSPSPSPLLCPFLLLLLWKDSKIAWLSSSLSISTRWFAAPGKPGRIAASGRSDPKEAVDAGDSDGETEREEDAPLPLPLPLPLSTVELRFLFSGPPPPGATA